MIAPRKPLTSISEPDDKDAFLRLLMAVSANAINDDSNKADELPFFMAGLQDAWADKPITEKLLREAIAETFSRLGDDTPSFVSENQEYYTEILVMTLKAFLQGARSPYDDHSPGSEGYSK